MEDQTCAGYLVCTYQPTKADIDPADTHTWTMRYQVDPAVDPLSVWVVSTDVGSFATINASTGLITFTFTDNTYAGFSYIVEVTIVDSDSDATGSTTTDTETLTLTVNQSDISVYPSWILPFNSQYFMDVGYKFQFLMPTYSASGINDIAPVATLTWRDGTDLIPLPNVVNSYDFSSQPM